MCKKECQEHKNKKKHELVKCLTKEPFVPYKPKTLHDIPASLTKISKLSVTDLRCVLQQQGLPTIGTKDELTLKVFLKKAKKDDFIARAEVTYMQNILKIAKEILHQEQRLSLLGFADSVEVRKYGTKLRVATLKKFEAFQSVNDIFGQLETFLATFIDPRCVQNVECEGEEEEDEESYPEEDTYNCFFEIGAKVKVYWEKEAVKDLDW
eukprot:TCONS_00035929-protein